MPTYAILIVLGAIVAIGSFCMIMDLISPSQEDVIIVRKPKITPKTESYIDELEVDSDLFES